jgi:hypothetical protein
MYMYRISAIGILSLSLLSGCASSTHDLIEQAQLTGDWALVDQRIAALERQEARKPPSCPRGTKPWCSSRQGKRKCGCVSDSEGREMLELLMGR